MPLLDDLSRVVGYLYVVLVADTPKSADLVKIC